MTGIEPAFSAWEADVLPLNYIRMSVSDLTTFLALVDAPPALPPPLDACPACDNTCCHGVAVRAKEHAMSVDERRSEERRVGKESRCRGRRRDGQIRRVK